MPSSSKYGATGNPIPVTGGIVADKTYFQSRNAIELSFTDSAISIGDSFSLLNETMGTTIYDKERAGTTLAGGSSELKSKSGLNAAGVEFSIKIYPTDSSVKDKFGFGEQILKLLVDDGGQGKSSQISITRKDFSLFAVAGSTFSQIVQSVGGLEVMPSSVAKSVLTNGTHTLTLGFIDTISH